MFKRYFLWKACSGENDVFIFLWIIIGVLVASALIPTALTIGTITVILLCFLMGIWVVVTYLVQRKHIILAKDFEGDILLKVRDGRVADVNDRFWKVKGYQYCPVGLPEVKEGKFTIDTSFTYELEKMETIIEPSLTFYVSPDVLQNGFVPQELYDHVVTKGYRSVSEMILDHFAGAVEDTPEIRIVLEDYSLNFFRLLSAIANALNRPMPIWLLSSIQKIEINLSMEDKYHDIYHEGEVVFPPRDVEIVCLGEEEDEQ